MNQVNWDIPCCDKGLRLRLCFVVSCNSYWKCNFNQIKLFQRVICCIFSWEWTALYVYLKIQLNRHKFILVILAHNQNRSRSKYNKRELSDPNELTKVRGVPDMGRNSTTLKNYRQTKILFTARNQSRWYR